MEPILKKPEIDCRLGLSGYTICAIELGCTDKITGVMQRLEVSALIPDFTLQISMD